MEDARSRSTSPIAWVTVFKRAPDTGVERTYQKQREAIGRLFMSWTDAELVVAPG